MRLLAALPGEDSGALLAAGSPLCELLAQRLCELYSLIPSTLDPADVQGSPLTQWRCVCVNVPKCVCLLLNLISAT